MHESHFTFIPKIRKKCGTYLAYLFLSVFIFHRRQASSLPTVGWICEPFDLQGKVSF